MTYLRQIPLAVAVVATVGLTACGSATSSTSTASAASAAGTVSATCQRVGAVLSDGPDPGADPVGYAEAQVDPLRLISTQDGTLRDAISKLADAYQEFYTSNGNKSAKEAVSVASNAINKICPGATS
jgi:hypothetical protein